MTFSRFNKVFAFVLLGFSAVSGFAFAKESPSLESAFASTTAKIATT